MNKLDTRITDCCALFYNATGLPVACFRSDGTLETAYPLWPTGLVPDVFSVESISDERNPQMYIAPSQGMYGRVMLKDGGYVVMGPAYSVPIGEAVLRSYMLENYIPFDQAEMAQALLYQSSEVSHAKFLQNLTFLHYCLTGEIIDPTTHFGMDDAEREFSIARHNAETMVEAKERKSFHNSYQYEQQLFELVRAGEPSQLLKFLNEKSTANYHIGSIAETPLRQAKDLLILTLAKVSVLAAIPGKLDAEQTYRLVDNYIWECEQAMTIVEVERIMFLMLMDFCRRIGALRIPQNVSQDIYKCMCFIHESTTEKISVADVAEHIERSSSYLLARFKKETGLSIGSYIIQCKLEDAARLLAHSDTSIADISNYFCFSSQSHFQNMFKKQYGITPMQYRKQQHG